MPEGFELDIYDFYPYDFLNGVVTGSPISYPQLVELIARQYVDLRSKNRKILRFHNDTKQIYLNRRDEFKPQMFDSLQSCADYISLQYCVKKEFAIEFLRSRNCVTLEDCKSCVPQFWQWFVSKFDCDSMLSVISDLKDRTIQFAKAHPFVSACLVLLPILSSGYYLLR